LLLVVLPEEDGPAIVIDIGTNTEVSLVNGREIIATSCASGPAFEGGHIARGVRAIEGAIDKVKFTDDKPSNIEISTIANCQPIGITGSGLVDIVSELLRLGVIEPSGKFKTDQDTFKDRFVGNTNDPEFVIVEGNATQTGQPITISQQDIRELQLAKAAICTGSTLLMRELKIEPDDLSEVLIAGAFGNYVNKESALAIKLLPEVPVDKIKSIGNAAGSGAKLALVSKEERLRTSRLATQIEYIELADHADFQDVYVASMRF